VVVTEEQAQQAVRDDKAHGYVGIKVYDHLSLAAYKAIVEEAKIEELPVFGHLPFAVPLEVAIQSHQASIEHTDSFLDDLQANPADSEHMTEIELYEHADLRKMPHFAKEMREAGVWVCPTVVLNQMGWGKEQVAQGMKYFSPEFLKPYLKHYENGHFPGSEQELHYSLALVGALHEAGVKLLAGSDAFKPNVVPGFSLNEELSYLVQAGLTPYEAIAAATSGAARFLNLAGEFGTVKTGLRADLLLVDRNPLEDVHNVAKRSGVMLRGKWFSESELQGALNKVAAVEVH
jgi:imidazolonepropionase-like amidohydrolase